MITPDQLKSPLWRLNNLYHIVNRSGKDEAFVPNAIQKHILENMWYRNIVFKSRKRGTSTLIQILSLDTALFEANQNCQLVDDTMIHAEEKMRQIAVYAYNHLPEEVKQCCPIKSQTQRQIIFENNSIIQVGTSSVGQTPTFLHVSELGKISSDTPDRARDILTGSIQSVASDGKQMVWVESTAWGRVGLFKEMVDRARRIRDLKQIESKLDMRLLFYPWYLGADNRSDDSQMAIPEAMEEYFARLKAPLDMAQKRWYCTQYDILGPDMLIQHPSTEDEPFSVAIEGAYFSHQFKRVYAERRISSFGILDGYPVHTSWDIGMHDYMAIWFWQVVEGFAVAVDYYENSNQGLPHYADILNAKGYRYGTHYAPHDINVKEVGTGKTRIEQASELGLRFKIVPKIQHKMDAIEAARRLLDHVKFDETRCAVGTAHVEAYRKKWNPTSNGWSDEPADTGDQHAADALMTFAQADGFRFSRAAVITGESKSEWSRGRW